jgi:hypothetical protein
MNFGGIKDLGIFLKTLKEIPGYEQVSTMVIARDAETNPAGAVESIKTALKRNGFVIPDKPFQFSEGAPRIAYMVFPGIDEGSGGRRLLPGTLEDLCLSVTEADPVHECVDLFIDCLVKKGVEPLHSHKARLHTFLAGKGDFAGLKIGEAAKAGVWNWEHPKLLPFRRIIEDM